MYPKGKNDRGLLPSWPFLLQHIYTYVQSTVTKTSFSFGQIQINRPQKAPVFMIALWLSSPCIQGL